MATAPIRRALLSVSDKTGLVDLARALAAFEIEILSTGGTARTLREAGVEIIDVGEFTGFPEMLDGRVKTLHPRVHAGILYRRDVPEHCAVMDEHGLVPIDLVVVNLYPFEATVARPDVTWDEAIEQIDIGGPTLLRSAAKNHAAVTVVSDPAQYGDLLLAMRENGGATTLELRRRFAAAVYRRTSEYDRAITAYFARAGGEGDSGAGRAAAEALPETLEVRRDRAKTLRYGENPHQPAALYGSFLDHFEKLHGKEISYNNILDISGAMDVAASLDRRGAAVSIIKHSNPCGAAVDAGGDVAAAWCSALACDPQSASGGIIASSRPIDAAAAEAMAKHFIEVLIAPEFTPEALEVLQQKKNRILLRLIDGVDGWRRAAGDLVVRSVPGGAVAMRPDDVVLDETKLRVMTKREPTDDEMSALLFAWEVVRFVKSNAIVYSGPDRLLGVGAGQMSRVDSARIGVTKAGDAGLDLNGAAVASDAFFPFPDGLLVAADAGVTAAIQPGGSVRDAEVVAAADERGMTMVFTGQRHFRH